MWVSICRETVQSASMVIKRPRRALLPRRPVAKEVFDVPASHPYEQQSPSSSTIALTQVVVIPKSVSSASNVTLVLIGVCAETHLGHRPKVTVSLNRSQCRD